MYSEQEQHHLNQLTEQLVKHTGHQSAKEKIEALRQVINYHDWRYYALSQPVILDVDYDKLFKELKQLETEHPGLISPDSPTQRVARGLTDDFKQVSHLVSMLSLDNSYNAEDVFAFDKSVKKLTGAEHVAYCIEPKFDGSSIALVYENDMLIRAATRGDGAVGEDITNNAKALASIPLSAKFSIFGIHKIEIRGEVIIQKNVFEQSITNAKPKAKKPFKIRATPPPVLCA